jgi:hypothetical protein
VNPEKWKNFNLESLQKYTESFFENGMLLCKFHDATLYPGVRMILTESKSPGAKSIHF